MWKTKFRDINQKLEANELNPTMKDAESIESRTENIILVEWNYKTKTSETMEKSAQAILTLIGSSYSCEVFFLHMNFIKPSTRKRLGSEISVACVKNYQLSALY